MSTEFERVLPPYRLVDTNRGDTLQSIANREMGDANRWPELVWINNLVWPYITDDSRRVKEGVLLSGSFIKVPAAAGVYTDEAEKGQVYERDCRLVNKSLEVDSSGDLLVCAGADNLRQQLGHRVATPRGQATRHPDYGCMIWRLLGKVNNATSGFLGAAYVKSTLEADYRVQKVDYSKSAVIGDAINITARAVAIDGGVVDLDVQRGMN